MIKEKTKNPAGSTQALALGLLLAVLVAASLALTAKPAQADKTFTVNSVGDQPDARLSDGSCDTNGDVSTGLQCTLRAAIQQANASLGADTINFDATENTEIRPGKTNARPLIQLNGTFVEGDGFTDGLDIGASDVVVRGLVISRFVGNGIDVTGRVTGLKLEGNFIGVDPSGTKDFGNGAIGVHVFDTEGSHTIGGASPGARNLISGNDSSGVALTSEARGSRIEGNLIGTDATGTRNLGNTFSGVFIGSSGVTVGGARSGVANTIAFNVNGVSISNPNVNNRVLGNSIFSNNEQGIDLGLFDGATPNDPGDADTGANNLQNFPVLSSATTSDGKTTIKGRLKSAPGRVFLVQFFSNPSGADEGKTFLGKKSVTTGFEGKAAFTFVPSLVVPAGRNVTATATDTNGNTSEFSAPRTVVAR